MKALFGLVIVILIGLGWYNYSQGDLEAVVFNLLSITTLSGIGGVIFSRGE